MIDYIIQSEKIASHKPCNKPCRSRWWRPAARTRILPRQSACLFATHTQVSVEGDWTAQRGGHTGRQRTQVHRRWRKWRSLLLTFVQSEETGILPRQSCRSRWYMVASQPHRQGPCCTSLHAAPRPVAGIWWMTT